MLILYIYWFFPLYYMPAIEYKLVAFSSINLSRLLVSNHSNFDLVGMKWGLGSVFQQVP